MSNDSQTASTSAERQAVMHFDVHPSVLFKLGEDLISDDAQALSELIKNSYDADARVVRVTVDTENWYSRDTGELLEDGDEPGAVLGMVRVTDNGTGMNLNAIRRGWLTVSYSEKRILKARGGKTRGARVPLGDKGLGRLGVQRLGRAVLLETVPVARFEGEPGASTKFGEAFGDQRHRVIIDWTRFDVADSLGSVSLRVDSEVIPERPAGTTVTVLGLSNRGYWTSRADLDLQQELTSIISPYDRASDLTVSVTLNTRSLDLRQQAKKLLDSAPWHMSFNYADGVLTVESELNHALLSGRNPKEKRAYKELIPPDGGYAFAQSIFDSKPKRAAERGMEMGDDRYFLRFRRAIALTEVGDASAVDPGSFSGEISTYSFDLARSVEDDVDPAELDTRRFAKALSGIRVFRDGFGIRLAKDWLDLAGQQTTATSYYGLRPDNTAGYVNLTVEHNTGLEETSSREAFRDTLAWRSFYALMRIVVSEARLCIELVRREWNDYRREALEATFLPETATPAEIVGHIDEQLQQARQTRNAATAAREGMGQLSRTVERLVASSMEATNTVWSDPALRNSVNAATSELQAAQQKLELSLTESNRVWLILQELSGSAALLEDKLAVAERRIADAWESVALGLSAELLAHEVDNIGERLRGRSYQILDYLRAQEPRDTRTLGFADQVRTSSNELLRQSARLNPSLRFRRERKTVGALSLMLGPVLEYHRSRLKPAGIDLDLNVVNDFRVKFNDGKLTQIVDNLVLNAEYWVRRSLQQENITRGQIALTIDSPWLLITDNGPGVNPSVQDSLFDAFVTTKPELEGRGLGLFVVRQLVESEGGSITLRRDADGQRPRTFELDLRTSITSGTLGEVVD
ncbi:sensor histidine kinase [Microbacterium sp. VKM Ac-2923]|uniref:sensor histidine kinase n=1 Tax=Microbacterium sp. VKM Ac-2923 TaxID=2929476 RepID=UPI001FB4B160|nr:sensor histidine kinase [Microbacterium sp. VKM Ac-2923]MCJ1708376.1 ATP-binding protein [Microbacterium sp. VKM Ac-2923]